MSAEQSYARHVHHPVQSYAAAILVSIGIVHVGAAWLGLAWASRDFGALCVALAVLVLVSVSRVYIVRLQDRIILLEMKVRGAELLTPEQEAVMATLKPKQVIALRFASDAEFPALVQRAAREQLPPDQIKREIKDWRPDLLRT